MKLVTSARAVVIAVVALALAACAPITTHENYAASDGLQVELGDVTGLNLLLVTADGVDGAVLTGTLANHGMDEREVNISIDGESAATIAVPPMSTVKLSADADTLVIGTITTSAGLLADVAFGTPEFGGVLTPVPVVDGTLSEYRELSELVAVAVAAAQPEPSPEPTEEPSPTAEASVSPSPEA